MGIPLEKLAKEVLKAESDGEQRSSSSYPIASCLCGYEDVAKPVYKFVSSCALVELTGWKVETSSDVKEQMQSKYLHARDGSRIRERLRCDARNSRVDLGCQVQLAT